MKAQKKISRRNFLLNAGVAAGAAAAIPALNSVISERAESKSSSKNQKLYRQRHPAFAAYEELKPVQILSRPVGTCRLQLDKRPR